MKEFQTEETLSNRSLERVKRHFTVLMKECIKWARTDVDFADDLHLRVLSTHIRHCQDEIGFTRKLSPKARHELILTVFQFEAVLVFRILERHEKDPFKTMESIVSEISRKHLSFKPDEPATRRC